MAIRSTHSERPKKKGHPRLLLLLLVPCALLLWPGLYNLDQPELAGIPFFYWFQMLCIIITATLIAILYKVTE